jgi:hypothetical protein
MALAMLVNAVEVSVAQQTRAARKGGLASPRLDASIRFSLVMFRSKGAHGDWFDLID